MAFIDAIPFVNAEKHAVTIDRHVEERRELENALQLIVDAAKQHGVGEEVGEMIAHAEVVLRRIS